MKKSAGILMFRHSDSKVEFLLAHPGGPLWKNKDAESWSIPKGEFTDEEDPLEAAKREFEEETGTKAKGEFIMLDPVKLKSGKIIHAWALKSDFDIVTFKSNNFMMEWPPKSGRQQSFPEIDKIEWFPTEVALEKINMSQAAFIREVLSRLNR